MYLATIPASGDLSTSGQVKGLAFTEAGELLIGQLSPAHVAHCLFIFDEFHLKVITGEELDDYSD